MTSSAHQFPELYKDSIAIIGQGIHCAGGADSAEAFYQLLQSAKDVSERVPHRRFNADAFGVSEHAADKRGKTDAPFGYFCRDVTSFDTTPGLFGMSPTEVKHVDPQQRQLLLLTADAIRNAGLSMGDVFNTNTGVFIGNMNRDYMSLQPDADMINQYSSQGSAAAIAANRISFTFNFRGCSVAIDSACSATGIGIHMAYSDLLKKNIDMAVVGGFNLIVVPYNYIGLSQLQVLSKVGRIQAFDEGADGYTRGEGGGVVLLKRFEDAVRDGNRILAVVATSATCSNGRTVTPMAAPSLEGQMDLLKRTFSWAGRRGIKPCDVQYIECHGTGTHRGDSIEVNACGQYFFKETPQADRPPSLYIGSVKANVGHLEAAACIPSVIKVVKCLEHKMIPKQINYSKPNKEIVPEYLERLLIPGEHVAWEAPPTGLPRMALVNSYGYGGSGAQLLVMEYVPSQVSDLHLRLPPPPAALVVWGHTKQAVLRRKELHVAAMRHLLTKGVTSPHEYCSGASAVSNNLAGYHCVASASSVESLIERLQAAAVVEVAHRLQPVALVFPGQGSQSEASAYFMQLPSYRKPLKLVEDWLIRRRKSFSILASSKYDKNWPLCVQNLFIFAHEVALGHLLFEAAPQLVSDMSESHLSIVGHSLGDYAASYFTHKLTLVQCCDAIWGVGEAVEPCRHSGYMAEIARSHFDSVEQPHQVDIACLNSPDHYIISGANADLQPFVALGAIKIASVDFPFHSRAINSAEAAVKARLKSADVPQTEWWDNLRGAVDFVSKLAVVTASTTKPKLFIEMGMQASLSTAVVKTTKQDCLCLAQHVVRVLTNLRTAGYRIRWNVISGVQTMIEESLVPLPMHLESHWFESLLSFRQRMGYFTDRPITSENGGILNHFVSIKGEQRPEETPAALYEYKFDPASFPLLGDHIYNKNSLVPGTFWVDVYCSFAESVLSPKLASWRVLNVEFKKACFSPVGTVLTLRLAAFSIDEKSFSVQAMYKQPNGTFTTCSQCVVEFIAPQSEAPQLSQLINQSGFYKDILSDRRMNNQQWYTLFKSAHFDFGPRFTLLDEYDLVRTGSTVPVLGDGVVKHRTRCDLSLGEAARSDLADWDFPIHPGLIDAATQAIAVLSAKDQISSSVPSKVGEITYFGRIASDEKYVAFTEVLESPITIELAHVLIAVEDKETGSYRPVMLLRNFECKVLELNVDDLGGNNSSYYRMELVEQELDCSVAVNSEDRHVLAMFSEGDAAAAALATRLAGMDDLQVTVVPIGPTTNLNSIHPPTKNVKVALIVSGESTQPTLELDGGSDTVCQTTFAAMGNLLHLFHAAEHVQLEAPELTVAVVTTARVIRSPPAAVASSAAQQAVVGRTDVDIPVAQSLLGAFRIFNVEHHEAKSRFIELVATDVQKGTPISRLHDEITFGWTQPKLESHVLLSDSSRHVGVFDRVRILKRLETQQRLLDVASGTWLLAGGCGAMGLALAKYLSESLGAKSVVLMSRRGVAERDLPLLNELDQTIVRVVKADVTDFGSLSQAALALQPPVAHVINLAMVLNDKFIRSVTEADIQQIGRPKVVGSWNLHRLEAMLPRPYQTFWTMSSTTALVGTGGQYVYGSSNAFMDGIVAWRRARGLAGISLQLGPVSGIGFLSREEGQAAKTLLERSGWVAHTPEILMGIFQDVLLRQELMPMVSSPLQLAPNYFVMEHRKWKIYERLITAIAAEVKEVGLVTHGDALAVVKRILAQELRYNEDTISGETSLNNLGVTSMVQNILSLAIQENFSGVAIPQSFFLSPEVTPNAIATEIVDRCAKMRAASSSDETSNSPAGDVAGRGRSGSSFAPVVARSPLLLWLSGSSDAGLKAISSDVAKIDASHPQAVITECIARSARRHPQRLSTVDDGQKALSMNQLLEGAETTTVHQRDPTTNTSSSIEIFVFPGQGTQFVGMAKPFYDQIPMFRHIFDAVMFYFGSSAVADVIGSKASSFVDKLRTLLLDPTSQQGDFNDTRFAQCGLFVMECCLARTLLDCGVSPIAAAGHSIGELAAKATAGELILSDAVSIVATRAFAMHQYGHGRMAAVQLTAGEVNTFIRESGLRGVEIAAVNAETNIVISGPEDVITAAVKLLKERGSKALLLPMPHAFHTSGMSPAKEKLSESLAKASLRPSRIPLVSNFTGDWTAMSAPDPKFYLEQLDHCVLWDQCAKLLTEKILAAAPSAKKTVIEVGPGTVLGNLIKKKLPENSGVEVLTCCANSSSPLLSFLGVSKRLWLANPTFSPSPLFIASSPWSDPTRRVVLTGSTTFLGIHVLHSFLTLSSVTLVLPIAARSDAERFQQIIESLAAFGLPRHEAELRHRATVCDKDAFDETATDVIHCTTSMNSLVDYEGVKEANVTWATALAQRCIESGAVLHYISTMSCMWGHADGSTANESMMPSIDKASMARHNGYTQSKIVMEHRLRTMAATKGLKYAVYRVDMLGGGADSGVLPPNAYFTSLLRSVLKAKAYPKVYTGPSPRITVDEAAAQIMLLAGRTAQYASNTYHITSGQPLFSIEEFAEGFRGVSYTEFKGGLGHSGVSEQPLQALLEKRDLYTQTPVDFRATHEALRLASHNATSSLAPQRSSKELAAACRRWMESQEI